MLLRSSVTRTTLTCTQGSPLSASEFVASLPRGAYTTARVLKGTNRIFELQRQVDRLVFSSQPFLREAKMLPSGKDELALRLAILSTIEQTVLESPHVQDSDCKLTVLVAVEWPDVKIHAHLEKMKPRTSGKPVRVVLPPSSSNAQTTTAKVMRTNATVKDSKWVQERESIVDPDAEETLLLDSHSEKPGILEGSQTNFFAVLRDGSVVTANEGILLGTVRAVVLDACRELNICVHFRNPLVEEIPALAGAFLASTSRLVMPIHVLAGTELPATCEVTGKIANWVQNHVEQRSVSAAQVLVAMSGGGE